MKKLIISILSAVTVLIAIAWGAIKFHPEKLAPIFIRQQLEANRKTIRIIFTKKMVLNHLASAPDNVFIKNMYLNELKGFDGLIHLANNRDKFIKK